MSTHSEARSNASSDLNEVVISGNLGADPVLSDAGSSKKCTFSIYTKRVYRNKAGVLMEETSPIDILTWNQQAENHAANLEVGQKVTVLGRIVSHSWEDKRIKSERKTRKATEVVATRVIYGAKRGQRFVTADGEVASANGQVAPEGDPVPADA